MASKILVVGMATLGSEAAINIMAEHPGAIVVAADHVDPFATTSYKLSVPPQLEELKVFYPLESGRDRRRDRRSKKTNKRNRRF